MDKDIMEAEVPTANRTFFGLQLDDFSPVMWKASGGVFLLSPVITAAVVSG